MVWKGHCKETDMLLDFVHIFAHHGVEKKNIIFILGHLKLAHADTKVQFHEDNLSVRIAFAVKLELQVDLCSSRGAWMRENTCGRMLRVELHALHCGIPSKSLLVIKC
jgi:hypothetical protein